MENRRFVLYFGGTIGSLLSSYFTFLWFQSFAVGGFSFFVFLLFTIVIDGCMKISCGMEAVERVKKKDYPMALVCFALCGISVYISVLASTAYLFNLDNKLAQQAVQESDGYKDNRTLLSNKQKEIKAIEENDPVQLLTAEKKSVINKLENERESWKPAGKYKTKIAMINQKIATAEKEYNNKIATAAAEKQEKLEKANKDMERISSKEIKQQGTQGLNAFASNTGWDTKEVFGWFSWFFEISIMLLIMLSSGTALGEKIRIGSLLKALPGKASNAETQKKTLKIVDLTKKEKAKALPGKEKKAKETSKALQIQDSNKKVVVKTLTGKDSNDFKSSELKAYIKRCWANKKIGDVADGYKRICQDIEITSTVGNKIRGHLEQIGAIESRSGSTYLKKEMREII